MEFGLAKFIPDFWLLEFLKRSHHLEWDFWNTNKIFQKHGITEDQVESCFADITIVPLGLQTEPLSNEKRYGVLAKDRSGKILFISFTVRNEKIRPISCRVANQKERFMYGR